MISTCSWIMDDESECGELCEGRTIYCASHNRQNRKEKASMIKAIENSKLFKHNTLIAKQREKAKQPRKTISKNPKDWSNTFLCSDGTRVTQAEIVERRSQAYERKYGQTTTNCEACGGGHTSRHAHIIPQARCKVIGKTELIWHPDNFFRAHNQCNAILENPKNTAWKNFLNIEKCLSFIKQHDPELFMKFELSSVNQERETI